MKREMKSFFHIKTCTNMFKVLFIMITENWRQPKYPSSGGWINKLWYTHEKETNH